MAETGSGRFVSRAEYARHRGVSKAAVTQWAAAGRIAVAENGRVDLAASDAMIEATGGSSRGGARRAGQAGTAQGAPVASAVTTAAPEAAQTVAKQGELVLPSGTLIQARTREAEIRVRMQDIEYRQRVGELVERSRYDKALVDALAPIMAALDSLSARVGPAVAGENDLRRVQNLIDAGVADVRQDLADTLGRMVDGASGTRQ